MNSYTSQIEQQMQQFYHSLSEKDRRRYAAIEAVKLGWGGISYISQLLGCDYYTIRLGIEEQLKKTYLEAGNPVLSMDTKKKN
jgi:hypothetical protein